MSKVNRRLGRNVFSSIMLLVIISSTLFSGIAFSEDISQFEKDYSTANNLLGWKKYQEAKELYQSVAQNSSDSNLAFKSLIQVVRCEIKSANHSAAKEAVKILLSNYSEHDGLCDEIDAIILEEYWEIDKYADARTFCQFVFNNASDINLTLKAKAKAWIVGCELRTGNVNAIDEATIALEKDYAQHKDYCAYLIELANVYRKRDMIKKAIESYQYILKNSTDRDLLCRSVVGIANCSITLGNHLAAEKAINKLKEHFSKEKNLCSYMIEIAKIYWEYGRREKAIETYQYIVSNINNDDKVIQAQKMLVILAIYTDNDSASKQAMNDLKKNFSNHPDFYTSINQIGMKYLYAKKFPQFIDLFYYIYNNNPNSASKFNALMQIGFREMKSDSMNDQISEEATKFLSICSKDADRNRYFESILLSTRAKEKHKNYVLGKLANEIARDASLTDKLNFIRVLVRFADYSKYENIYNDFAVSCAKNGKCDVYIKLLDYLTENKNHSSVSSLCQLYLKTDAPAKDREILKLKLEKSIVWSKIEDIKLLAEKNSVPDYHNACEEFAKYCNKNGKIDSFLEALGYFRGLKKYNCIIDMCDSYLGNNIPLIDRKIITLKMYEAKVDGGSTGDGLLELLEKYSTENMDINKKLACEAMLLRGQLLINSGKIEEAQKMYELYISKQPESDRIPELLFFIGYSQLLLGDLNQAKSNFVKLRSDFPSSPYSLKAMKYLNQIPDLNQ